MNTILNQSNLLEQKFHALIMRQNFITKKKFAWAKDSVQDKTEPKTKPKFHVKIILTSQKFYQSICSKTMKKTHH